MNRQKLFFTTVFLIVLIASLPLASAYSLTYDANGNLITGDGKYRMYNGFNKLVQVREGDNATTPILENYTWHPLEDRIFAKSVYQNGSWQETVFYITKNFVRVQNATGTFDYKYIYQNGQLVAQQNPDGSKLFMHNDNLGSVGLVTNESGAKVEETFYEPFGKIISGGTASRYQYEAKEYSSVVGDYDFHARKYIPGIGWTQPDTIIQNVYDPQSLNRYAFERNNPVKYTDESGHAIQFIALTAILVYFIATEWDIITDVSWEVISAAVDLYKTKKQNREEKEIQNKPPAPNEDIEKKKASSLLETPGKVSPIHTGKEPAQQGIASVSGGAKKTPEQDRKLNGRMQNSYETGRFYINGHTYTSRTQKYRSDGSYYYVYSGEVKETKK